MFKIISLVMVFGVVGGVMVLMNAQSSESGSAAAASSPKSVYDFQMKDIDGKDVKLEKYKGNVLLVVNTAAVALFQVRRNDRPLRGNMTSEVMEDAQWSR